MFGEHRVADFQLPVVHCQSQHCLHSYIHCSGFAAKILARSGNIQVKSLRRLCGSETTNFSLHVQFKKLSCCRENARRFTLFTDVAAKIRSLFAIQ